MRLLHIKLSFIKMIKIYQSFNFIFIDKKLTIQTKMTSPWKCLTNNLEDPIMMLSNKKLSESNDKTNYNSDRFVPEIIKKNLFKTRLDFDEREDLVPSSETSLNETIRKKQQKRLYNKLLCSSINKISNQYTDNYQIRNRKSGYMVNQQSDLLNPKEDEVTRCIPKHPYKILDAPKLKDDFYTSLLDWSKDDIISVVLDNAVYIWSGKGLQAQKLTQGYVSCVKWGKGLILGEQTGRVRILDAERKKQISRYKNHSGRIGCADTYSNLVVSGSKDSDVMVWDVRSNVMVTKFEGHQQQVCGVKWSFDGNMLASGGNDNLVHVWSLRMNKMMVKFTQHTAAVKALAWSPHKNSLLATGGGSTDKSIKLWDTHELKCIKSTDTGSQVCNMAFSASTNELISTHGYSLNSIAIWKVKDMQKIATLQGHSYRVLYLAKSPDEETILTGSGDQTLRFWKIFPSPKTEGQSMSSLEQKNYIIR